MTAPARTTRNDASPNGGRYSSPIFTAIKLSAQTKMTSAIEPGCDQPAAPGGAAVPREEIVEAPRQGVPADTAKLDVDDLAGAQFDGGARLLFRMNALIQTDWRVEFLLKFDVAVEVVPAERLFDHHQVEAFELFQQRPVIQSVRRVCVNHQLDAGEILPKASHRLQVFPRLNFDLDSLIACREFLLHGANQLFK